MYALPYEAELRALTRSITLIDTFRETSRDVSGGVVVDFLIDDDSVGPDADILFKAVLRDGIEDVTVHFFVDGAGLELDAEYLMSSYSAPELNFLAVSEIFGIMSFVLDASSINFSKNLALSETRDVGMASTGVVATRTLPSNTFIALRRFRAGIVEVFIEDCIV